MPDEKDDDSEEEDEDESEGRGKRFSSVTSFFNDVISGEPL